MRKAFISWQPHGKSALVVDQANEICRDYGLQGYDLTLRQLYYQFVARGLVENTQQSYKRIGDIVNNARMAGLMSWSYIVDRTRNLVSSTHWDSPKEIIESAAYGYAIDKRADQEVYVEVWVEKEALAGVIGRASRKVFVPYFSCRGYVSQSEQHAAALRFKKQIEAGQKVVVVHLGDHDPSGIDMTRDITDRIARFLTVELGLIGWSDPLDPYWDQEMLRDSQVVDAEFGEEFEDAPLFQVRRIALNHDQVRQYNPPPNPAKLTDSRVGTYLQRFGGESWELDALDPQVLNDLIVNEVGLWTQHEKVAALVEREDAERRHLLGIAENYDTLTW